MRCFLKMMLLLFFGGDGSEIKNSRNHSRIIAACFSASCKGSFGVLGQSLSRLFFPSSPPLVNKSPQNKKLSLTQSHYPAVVLQEEAGVVRHDARLVRLGHVREDAIHHANQHTSAVSDGDAALCLPLLI